MASLTKRARSKFWVACFTNRTGRRMKRSTKSANRKQAQKIADQWEESYRKKRTALQFRRVLTEGQREITGEDVSHTSLRAFVDSWLAVKAPEIASSTASFYRNAADKFIEFLGEGADRDLTEITRDQITQFRNAEAKRFAPMTVNHEVKFLRMLFRAARRDALVSDDPSEFVKTI